MSKLSGTETFTYTLAKSLVRKGHEVNLITHDAGFVSDKLFAESKGLLEVNRMVYKESYDLSLINHNTVVDLVYSLGIDSKIIQTCHGVTPELEQPSKLADCHISITNEVKDHLKGLGFQSEVILNGVDLDRFYPTNKINPTIKKVLSLCHDERANKKIEKVCSTLGADLIRLNKNDSPKWEVESIINQSDLVFGLGRGVYESMSCGRPCFVYDQRGYIGDVGDGMITPSNFNDLVYNNCSGRTNRRSFSVDDMVKEIKEHYSTQLSESMRGIAELKMDIDKQVDKYLDIKI